MESEFSEAISSTIKKQNYNQFTKEKKQIGFHVMKELKALGFFVCFL
jgi:hypothetical protein